MTLRQAQSLAFYALVALVLALTLAWTHRTTDVPSSIDTASVYV